MAGHSGAGPHGIRGIELDTKYLAKFADEINDMITDFEQQIYGHADQEFNIG